MNKYLREVKEVPEKSQRKQGKWQEIINCFIASNMKIAEVDTHAMAATPRQVYNGCMMAVRRNAFNRVAVRWRNSKVYLVKEDAE